MRAYLFEQQMINATGKRIRDSSANAYITLILKCAPNSLRASSPPCLSSCKIYGESLESYKMLLRNSHVLNFLLYCMQSTKCVARALFLSASGHPATFAREKSTSQQVDNRNPRGGLMFSRFVSYIRQIKRVRPRGTNAQRTLRGIKRARSEPTIRAFNNRERRFALKPRDLICR